MSQNPIYLTLDRRSNRIRITNGMLAYIYIPSQLGTFLKDDVLLVSYVNKIEKIQSETAWPIYRL